MLLLENIFIVLNIPLRVVCNCIIGYFLHFVFHIYLNVPALGDPRRERRPVGGDETQTHRRSLTKRHKEVEEVQPGIIHPFFLLFPAK